MALTELKLLRECSEALLDAADMMNDGPDDSDVAYAERKITVAIKKAKAAKAARFETNVLPQSEVDEFVGLPNFIGVHDTIPFYPTDDGE